MENNEIMETTGRLRTSMAANFIGAIVVLLSLFGLVSAVIGLISFTGAFQKEYATTTYHMADTAATLVNGDHLEAYFRGEQAKEFLDTKEELDIYCEKMSVSLIYVIMVDQSDYGRFVSVFNSVDNTVDDTEYVEWEIGHKRDTTNEEYRQKYKQIYENGSVYETVYRIKNTNGQHPHITTMVPVKRKNGEVAAILCVQRPVRELQDARRPYLISIAVSTALLAAIASFLATMVIREHFVEPIRTVSAEAVRFARENTKGKPLGDISRLEEIYKLAQSIDTMETDMVSYIENITKITAEKERIGTELTLANRIQAAMLPHVFPAFPDREEFDIYASMDPAREVGGDFYDYFLLDDDHLCMVMADVSGKGIPAALCMMVSKIIIQSYAQMGDSASEVLRKANDTLCSTNLEEMFVTVWLGVLELSTGRLVAANAGHEYPVIKNPGGSYEILKDKHGFVIGGKEDMVYSDYELQFEPGTKLFLYTDGLAEATDAENKMFGMQRILDVLNGDPDADAVQVLMNMRCAVDEFTKETEQFDDLTMLCMEYRGGQEIILSERSELEIYAVDENLADVQEFIWEHLKKKGCSSRTISQIDIAVEEIFINIAHYAYKPGIGKARVRVEMTDDPASIKITFTDRGREYDPLSNEDPDITLSAEDRKIGGLGIFMTKKLMDEVTYEYKDGRNILTMKKDL